MALQDHSAVPADMEAEMNSKRRDTRGAERLVTTRVAAELIDMPEASFRRGIALGSGPRVVRSQNSIRVRLADLFEWVDRARQ